MKLNQISLKRQNFWQDQFDSWRKSGLSQSGYCRQNKIDQQLFSKWKNKLLKIKGNTESRFVRIPKKILNDLSSPSEIELTIKDQYKIKVNPGFNPETLKKLLSILEDKQ